MSPMLALRSPCHNPGARAAATTLTAHSRSHERAAASRLQDPTRDTAHSIDQRQLRLARCITLRSSVVASLGVSVPVGQSRRLPLC